MNIMYEPYLMHHGVKGMKWGVRRYQNEDGTLTTAGKSRYRVTATPNRVMRVFAEGTLGQRLAVGMNAGYRKDKKVIKTDYQAKLKSLDKKSEDYKEKAAALKSEYKKDKADAATQVADAIYGKQSHELNEKIHSESMGKSFAKSLLLGDYGSLVYSEMRTDKKYSRIASAGIGLVASFGNTLTYGLLSGVDTGVRRMTGVTSAERAEVKAYNKAQKAARKAGAATTDASTSREKSSGTKEKSYSMDFLETVQNDPVLQRGGKDLDREYAKYKKNPEKYVSEFESSDYSKELIRKRRSGSRG